MCTGAVPSVQMPCLSPGAVTKEQGHAEILKYSSEV